MTIDLVEPVWLDNWGKLGEPLAVGSLGIPRYFRCSTTLKRRIAKAGEILKV